MEQQTKNLIKKAVETLAQTTGVKVVHQANGPKTKNIHPDALVRIDYKDMHWDFAIQAKARMTRATVAIEKVQPTLAGYDRILATDYVTLPMADLMKDIGLHFIQNLQQNESRADLTISIFFAIYPSPFLATYPSLIESALTVHVLIRDLIATASCPACFQPLSDRASIL